MGWSLGPKEEGASGEGVNRLGKERGSGERPLTLKLQSGEEMCKDSQKGGSCLAREQSIGES